MMNPRDSTLPDRVFTTEWPARSSCAVMSSGWLASPSARALDAPPAAAAESLKTRFGMADGPGRVVVLMPMGCVRAGPRGGRPVSAFCMAATRLAIDLSGARRWYSVADDGRAPRRVGAFRPDARFPRGTDFRSRSVHSVTLLKARETDLRRFAPDAAKAGAARKSPTEPPATALSAPMR